MVEYALGLLPTEAAAVRTPTGTGYDGMRVKAHVCGVSIVRSGESMEAALRRCWKGVDIGKILVTRRHKASPVGTPEGTPEGRAPSAAPAAAPPSTPPLATDVNGSYYKTHAEAEHGCAPPPGGALGAGAPGARRSPHACVARALLCLLGRHGRTSSVRGLCRAGRQTAMT